MTEDLRDLLRERAEGADLPTLDLSAVTAPGRRQVRRRRGLALGVGALAVALVAGGSVALAARGGSGMDDAGPATATDSGIPTTGLTWATGSTLHVGAQSYDLGHDVTAYVRTSAGYVFTDASGEVWSASRGGIEQVGSTSATQVHLVASQTGTTVGWVDDTTAGTPSFVLFDQATGFTSSSPAETGTTGIAEQGRNAWFEAVDGYNAYWRDAGVENAVTYFRANERIPTEQQGDPFANHPDQHVLAVVDGVYVLAGKGDAISFQRPDGTSTSPRQVYASTAELSPDGAYANLDADSPAVYDTRSGDQVDLDVQGYFADGYQWLDAHTLAVLALPTEKSDWQLLTCTVPDGACTVAVPHLGTPYDEASDSGPGFALPTGEALGG